MDTRLMIQLLFLIPGLWFAFLFILGLFPGARSTAIGTLTQAKTKKNIRTRGGNLIKNATRYTYLYTANRRTYKIKGYGYHTRRILMKKVTVVYLKGFSRHAYIKNTPGSGS